MTCSLSPARNKVLEAPPPVWLRGRASSYIFPAGDWEPGIAGDWEPGIAGDWEVGKNGLVSS